MPMISTEALSDDFLHVNSCGCQNISGNPRCIRPNGRIDYHILYIAEGICYVTIDNEIIEAPEGSVVVFLPHQRQDYMFRSETKSKSYYIHFSGTGCKELMQKFGLSDKNVFFIGKSRNLQNLLNSLVEEYYLKLDYFNDYSHGLLMDILTVIARKKNEPSSERQSIKNRINNVCRDIYANYGENLSVKDYADMCNLSESRFSHLFSEIMGVSPKQYILNAKIEMSKELLENTDLSISQISDMAGFQNQSYFSRIFKKYTGICPSAYR